MSDKKTLRITMKKVRSELENRIEKDSLIFKKCINTVNALKAKEKTSVFCYVSMNGEVDTKRILSYYIKEAGMEVFVPHTVNGDMLVKRLKTFTGGLNTDSLGNINESMLGRVAETAPDIAVVPMLAFNNRLYRLGYGGGYYDRFLYGKDLVKIGLAYDEQETLRLTEEAFDVPLDIIITPSRVIRRTNV